MGTSSFLVLCGFGLWNDLEPLWTFFRSAGGQLFLVGIVFFVKTLWSLLRSPMPEARELGVAILALVLFVTWIAVVDLRALSATHVVNACVNSGARFSGF